MRSARAVTWREAGWLAVTLAALAVTLAFEHWVVHRQVILPMLESSGQVIPWMWGALFAPELVVVFVAGWRLRSPILPVLYAASAAVLREGVEIVLALRGEPGHAMPDAPTSEFAFGAPQVALAYLVVLAIAASAGRSDSRLDGSGDPPGPGSA
jgi:hypothetical protein